MLFGREKELAVLAALIEKARDGRGAAVVVHGEPGIGKSELLDNLVSDLPDTRVLRAAGVEPESDFGYATLHQLLLPVLDRADRLPEPLSTALRVVFGLATGPVPDRFLVGLATLSLLSELTGDRPVVCVVDDAHWTDRSSADVLEFVARRLDTERIVLVLTARTGEQTPLTLPGALDLPLNPLDRAAARRLLSEADARLSPRQQDTILEAAAGNPLAILTLPAEPVPDGVPSSAPLPLSERLQSAFLTKVRQHTPPRQRLLLLIATAGQLGRETLARAAAEFDAASIHELGALDEFVVTADPANITFRHPLVRSAVYHVAGASDRRLAHRALAAAMSTAPGAAERRAWHLGQSVAEPDEDIAEQLDRAAVLAARVSSATSAALFARAGELSPVGPRRARRFYRAAAARWTSGDADRAGEMLRLLDREAAADETLRSDILWLRASIELHLGIPAEAVAMLGPLIPAVLEADPRQAVSLLMLFGEAGFHANLSGAWSEVAEVVEQLPLTGTDVSDVLLRLFRGACRVRRGLGDGLLPGDKEAVETLTDSVMLCWAGGVLWGLNDRERARRLNALALRRARSVGAAGVVVWALERQVVDDIAGGHFGSAEAAAEEGYRLAEEIGQSNASCWHRGALALVAALSGREQRARDLAHEALTEALPRHLADIVVIARKALGLLDLAAGRPDSALTYLLPAGDLVHPGIMPMYTPDLVEAAAHARKPDAAAGAFEALERRAASANSPELSALAARCRALLAAPDVAEDEFRRALALHERGEQPMEHARTRLLFGEYLRRRRRKAEAREALRAALETFESLGAVLWADRARAELRAAGEVVEPPPPTRGDQLTPQQIRIVEAVANGLTNREIAAHMFLSARTVDYHLRKIFNRLDVRSRGELIRVALTDRNGDN